MIFGVSTSIKTPQLPLKDKYAKVLRQMMREINQVWNHINEVSAKVAWPFHGRSQFLSGDDLQKCTAGYSPSGGVSVGSGTVQRVCVKYATRHKQFKKERFNWRVSNQKSPKYSLGWIPFKGGRSKCKAGQIHFAGQKDGRGRWYFNVTIDFSEFVGPRLSALAVGIDLVLKGCATASNEQKLCGCWYRQHENAVIFVGGGTSPSGSRNCRLLGRRGCQA